MRCLVPRRHRSLSSSALLLTRHQLSSRHRPLTLTTAFNPRPQHHVPRPRYFHTSPFTMSSATLPPGRTYADALATLNLLIPNRAVTSLFEKKTDDKAEDPNLRALPEMLDWLRRAGYFQSDLAALRCIHVAGTKGKGSVCAYLTSILAASPAAGKVGTYTSPHLVSPRERIAINGAPIPAAMFARYFFEVWDRFTAAARAEGVDAATAEGPTTKPFFFRFMTILAFHIFISEGVRSAVIEVGIGGAYDATNVLPKEAITAAVVTQLGVDHVAMLGDTREKIAWHKAGVIKEGKPVFTRLAEEQPGVMTVLRERAGELGASALVEVADEDVQAWGGVEGGRLTGDFQRYNQALAALAAEEHLAVLEGRTPARKLADLPSTLTGAMKNAALRGRHEVLQDARGVRWLLDGAHTTESLAETARWLASQVAVSPKAKVVLIFNQQERDASRLLLGFLDEVQRAGGPTFEAAIFTRNDYTAVDAVPEEELVVQNACRDAFSERFPSVQADVAPDLIDTAARVTAIEASLRGMGLETVALVTGSMHLVGNLIRVLEPEGDE
ncbi:folylpolyglutamate synthase [Plectosphaerella cucumerina]|uniref:tetrahydrofolate synthase n=1 Tax=Plectosphaerella cucumerina TaxID=40658 RepID=A0A8K0TNM2_9PEZI|nr:folylpolyglutamate synthase [Plectosphaerella cucumerina]